MTITAEQISQSRGKEIFLVETINTAGGKKYAIVSHREKIGQDKRIIETFDHTPAEHERAVRIARKFREDADAARCAQNHIEGSEVDQ